MYQLIPHPSLAPASPTLNISLDVTHSLEHGILIRYILAGEINSLAIPELQPPAATDNLWQHTCFEAFVGIKGTEEYYEFNFSPSTQWAAYAFSAYRQRKAWILEQAPKIQCTVSGLQLHLLAEIPASVLPANSAEQKLDLGLTAVIETKLGQLSYWALQHPAEKADFHHRDGFTLTFPPI